MPFPFKSVRMPSPMFWLQAAACAIVAWSLLHGALAVGPAATDPQAPDTLPDSNSVTPGLTTAPPASPAAAPARTSGAQLAATPSLAVALSRIDVIVTHNDTLDRIFRRLKLSLADLASLRSLPGLRAGLDSLRPGESLRLTHKDGQLFGLERRLNESETLQVVREPSGLKANVLQSPLEMRVRTVRGAISTSLFEAVEAAGAHDQTAMQLADIFGWDIDFALDVRPGDSFVVTYPEVWRDGVYLKDGPIQAAAFVNQGREFQAVRYTEPEGGSHYYTPEGRSLHRAFLRTPVEFTRVSSRFNSARLHPILNRIRAHQGVDYAAPMGTPVRAAGDGRIRFAGRKGGYGNLVEIEHSEQHRHGLWSPVALRARHARRRARDAGRGHRLRGHDRACDRAAPALRIPRQRGVQEPPDGGAPRSRPYRRTLACRLPHPFGATSGRTRSAGRATARFALSRQKRRLRVLNRSVVLRWYP